MKKLILVFTILLFLGFNVFGATVTSTDYLAPMASTGGIPMDPKYVDKETGEVRRRYTPITITPGVDPWKKVADANVAIPEGCYTDYEMISTGGIKWLGYNEYYDSSFVINVSCSNGFYFISQSNPNYRRPFEIHIVPKAREKFKKEWWIYQYYYQYVSDGDTFGPVKVMNDGNNRYEFSYKQMLGNKPISAFDKEREFWDEDHYPRLWFDMVLVLPGEVENDTLKWPGHGEFPLIEADDYSAVVTIDFQATVNGKQRDVITVSIPFTGFYKRGDNFKKPGTISMYIHPTAAFGNLDMKNYSRQQIAEMEVMNVSNPAVATKKKGFGVFLSSSPSPFDAGEQFKLVKENLSYDEPLNAYNSVEFDVILVDKKNISNEKRYTGKDSILNESISGDEKNVNKIPSVLFMPSANKLTSNTHSQPVDSWYLSANAYVEIKDNSLVTMEAGRYTSTVYVHVIGFN